MCLYIGYKKPFVAKSDITVYKYVFKNDGKYYTACRGYAVNTNEVMKAGKNNEVVLNSYNKYCIEGGVIHACTTTFDNGFDDSIYRCLRAVIRKGTEFYIQDDLKQVAAKELYITDEEVTGKESTDITEYFEDAIKNAESGNNGVKVGYYRLSNGNFVNPFEYKEGTIIGVVAFFDKNGNPVSIGVNFKKLPWMKRPFHNEISSNILYDKTAEDMDGMKHTKDILNSKDYDPDNFAAVEYCRNYSTEGTKPGDWYMPAIGECVKIAQNMLIINMSLSKAGFATFDLSYLWSSSECGVWSDSCVWRCSVDDGYCLMNHYIREDALFVCPASLSLTKRERSLHFNLLRKQFIHLLKKFGNGLI